jgi:hypothetical protein
MIGATGAEEGAPPEEWTPLCCVDIARGQGHPYGHHVQPLREYAFGEKAAYGLSELKEKMLPPQRVTARADDSLMLLKPSFELHISNK